MGRAPKEWKRPLGAGSETLWRKGPLALNPCHLLIRWILPQLPQAPESPVLCCCPAIEHPAVNSKEGQHLGATQATRTRDKDDTSTRPILPPSFTLLTQTDSGMAEPALVGREVVYCGGKQQALLQSMEAISKLLLV
jgi:hypothetical protein